MRYVHDALSGIGFGLFASFLMFLVFVSAWALAPVVALGAAAFACWISIQYNRSPVLVFFVIVTMGAATAFVLGTIANSN